MISNKCLSLGGSKMTKKFLQEKNEQNDHRLPSTEHAAPQLILSWSILTIPFSAPTTQLNGLPPGG